MEESMKSYLIHRMTAVALIGADAAISGAAVALRARRPAASTRR